MKKAKSNSAEEWGKLLLLVILVVVGLLLYQTDNGKQLFTDIGNKLLIIVNGLFGDAIKGADPKQKIIGSWECITVDQDPRPKIIFSENGEVTNVSRDGTVGSRGRYRFIGKNELELTKDNTSGIMTVEFLSNDEMKWTLPTTLPTGSAKFRRVKSD